MEKALEQEYRLDEVDESIADYLRTLTPSSTTIVQVEQSRQDYANAVVRELRRCRRDGHRKYIDDTPIHYVYASHDGLSNREGIYGTLRSFKRRDVVKNSWVKLTAGHVQETMVYGNHACLVEPIYGGLVRSCLLDIVQMMMT